MPKLESPAGLHQQIAAQLTAAAHMHVLVEQLRGNIVSIPEAITAVETTYNQLLSRPSPESIRVDVADPAPPAVAPESAGRPTAPVDDSAAAEPLTGKFAPQPRGQSQALSADTAAGPASPTGTVLRNPAAGLAVGTDPLLGSVLDGRYRILSALGAGGMGRVYIGEQIGMNRKVAIKVLPLFSQNQIDQAQKFFRQEALALSRLNHQNVAQVYDASTSGNSLYIAMELVQGRSLRDRLEQDKALPLPQVVRFLREIATGLEAAHRIGVIHRDIKPENLILTNDANGGPRVKVLDFGLAILDNRDAMGANTGAGCLAGTPSYMSPEQVSGLEVTPATDIYSLGVVGYEMLTGRNPFLGKSAMETMQNHLLLQPPPINSLLPSVTPAMEALIMRALEKDPVNRFASGAEFAQAL